MVNTKNETSKILNLLNEPNDPKFVTRKWNIVTNQSNVNYDVGNEIIYNTNTNVKVNRISFK